MKYSSYEVLINENTILNNQDHIKTKLNKFNNIDKKLKNYYTKFDKITELVDLIISDEYIKIYKTFYPMKNYDLSQDRFFIQNEIVDTPLKKIVILFLNIFLIVKRLIFH